MRRTQQIQASGRAFAAIRNDGSVITRGRENDGGDSTFVRKELYKVREIQSDIHSGFMPLSQFE